MEPAVDASYREYVRTVADGEWPSDLILNRSAGHAGIIIENLFRKAIASVEILTGRLNRDVYGVPEVVAAAENFLRTRSDAKIHILSEEAIDRNRHPLLARLVQVGLSDRVEISVVPESVRETFSFHFAVADGACFRFEESRDKFDAVVQFGEPEVGRRLHEKFIELAHESSVAP